MTPTSFLSSPEARQTIERAWHATRSQIWWRVLLVFVIIVVLFTWFLNAQTFSDPDAFYHVAMAEHLRDHRSIPHQFPWLSQTTLADHYTDHHFLYHVLLIPFVSLLEPFVGTKVFTVLLAGVVFSTIYLLLSRMRAPLPMLWVIALGTSYSFLFRLGLIKASGLSLLFLLTAFWIIVQPERRLWALFPLSFFFVWSYGGFIVLLLLACCLAVGAVVSALLHGMRWAEWKHLFVEQSFIVLSIALGMLFGLLIHPSFPDHLFLLWQQIVDIGIVNQRDVISVGREWYPIVVGDLPKHNIFLFALWSIAAFFALASWRRLRPETWGLWIFNLVLIVFTLKSQRYVEYAVPWSLMSAAFTLRDVLAGKTLLQHIHAARLQLQSLYTSTISSLRPLLIVLLLLSITLPLSLLLYGSTESIERAHRDLHGGIPYQRSAAVGAWMQKNIPTGEVIYTSEWDIFPELFYFDRSHYYIVGLDPTFMYKRNADQYWTWFNINTGRMKENVSVTIRDRFHAQYALVEVSNQSLRETLESENGVKPVYTDSTYIIYSLPTQ